MSKAFAHPLKLRLFLEGIEVPVIAANVQTAPSSPSIADIQILPLAEGSRFFPRTLVHLFFLDQYAEDNPFAVNTPPGGSVEHNPTAYEKSKAKGGLTAQRDTDNASYKLLFAGEVVGFSWTKQVYQRSLVLHCEDFSNYWDYAYQFNNSGLWGPGIKAVFSGGNTNLFTDFLSTPGATLAGFINQGKCNTFPNLKGLAAGVVRMIEAIGGSYFPPTKNSGVRDRFKGMNIFFSLAELRLHITHMIAALEDDTTSEKLMARQGYSWLFSRALGGMGGQVSIRNVMNALQKVIFHETYAQPCPLYIPGREATVEGVVRHKLSQDLEAGFIYERASWLSASASVLIADITAMAQVGAVVNTAAETQESTPPDGVSKDVDLLYSQLNVNNADSILRPLADAKRLSVQALARNIQQLRARTDAIVDRSELKAISKCLSAATTYADSALEAIEFWIPRGSSKITDTVISSLNKIKQELQYILDDPILTLTESKDVDPARLVQHIFRPDIWFGSPPRCNVIFPEHYFEISYKRMFLQEPTRFLLKTNDEFFGENFLMDRYFFAPQAGTTGQSSADLKALLSNDLLLHELYTGVLPVFEKMGEFNVYVGKGVQTDLTNDTVGYAQRSANFIYFKHRFSARRMRVSGKFNPYIACGFPGLILDTYVDRNTIKNYNDARKNLIASGKFKEGDLPPKELSEILGTNFLGNFTQTSHRISQAEMDGRTEIIAAFPRQPEESVEFLGAVDSKKIVRKRENVDATRATYIAALNAPSLYSLGPNAGRVIAVQEVTSQFVSGFRRRAGIGGAMGEDVNNEGKLLPLFVAGKTPRGKRPPVVPIGEEVTAAILSDGDGVIASIVGGRDVPVIFKAFAVTEEIPRYRREEILLPAEEYIRPGWYGEAWHPSKIGKAYYSFFRTGAITDKHVLGEVPGFADAAADAQAADAPDDPRVEAPTIVGLEEGASIQQAVEFIILAYSYIRQAGFDVDEFIKAYTWRPIATMVDMFGTSDLEFAENGIDVVSGIEGFHSRAFGPYEDVFSLVPYDVTSILGLKKPGTDDTAQSRAATRGDTRKTKWDAVQKYMASIRVGRAVLG